MKKFLISLFLLFFAIVSMADEMPMLLSELDKAIKERKDFAIDNTNIKAGRVQNFYSKLKKVGANVQIIIIDTPKEICKERRKNDIPEKVIDDMQLGIDKVKKVFKNNKDTKIISDRY